MDETSAKDDLLINSLAFLEVTKAKARQLSREQQLYFNHQLSRLEQAFVQANPGEDRRLKALSDELVELGKDLSSMLIQNRHAV